jgi:hypothetical protein
MNRGRLNFQVFRKRRILRKGAEREEGKTPQAQNATTGSK